MSDSFFREDALRASFFFGERDLHGCGPRAELAHQCPSGKRAYCRKA